MSDLQVRTKRAVEDEDRQTGIGTITNRDRALLLQGDQLLGEFVRDVGRSHVRGNRRSVGWFSFGQAFLLKEGAKATDSNFGIESGDRQRAGDARIDQLFVANNLLIEARFAVVKTLQVRQAITTAAGDVVKLLLHFGGEADIDEIREVIFEQARDRHAGKGRHKLVPHFTDVTTILHCADDALVG